MKTEIFHRHNSIVQSSDDHHESIVKLLKLYEPIINTTDNNDEEYNLMVNYQDVNGMTLLIAACYSDEYDKVKKIINNPDINVNIKDNADMTALMVAVTYNNEIALLLLEVDNIDVDIKRVSGNTVLHDICMNGKTKLLSKVISLTNNINVQNNNEETPLMLACQYGYKKIVEELLNVNNIDINIENKDGLTAKDILQIYDPENKKDMFKLI